MEEEIWKDIKYFEGKYQVSNLGRARSLNFRRTGKVGILKLSPANYGFKEISLYGGYAPTTIGIHRAVAEAFIPNPYDLPNVRHIDGNKANNKADNLEWCDMYNQPELKEKRIKKVIKTNSRPVRCIDTGKVYPSVKEAEKQNRISKGGVYMCCSGRRSKTKGLRFEYLDKKEEKA